MTVEELIKFLKKQPKDAVVLYRAMSDYSELETDEINLVTPEDKKIVWREQNGYSEYKEYWWPKGMVPDFRTCLLLPGN